MATMIIDTELRQRIREMLESQGDITLHQVASELKISRSDAKSAVVEIAGDDIRRAKYGLAVQWTSRES
jgi:predicted ArsR family transcriptional regulator